jgi:hypothetical protein
VVSPRRLRSLLADARQIFSRRWKQGTRLEIGFYAKGTGKSQIAVQVSRLARKGDVEPVRHAWKAALTKLQTLLED